MEVVNVTEVEVDEVLAAKEASKQASKQASALLCRTRFRVYPALGLMRMKGLYGLMRDPS